MVMDDSGTKADEKNSRIIDQELPPEAVSEPKKEPRRIPPGLKEPLPDIPAAGTAVAPWVAKFVWNLRQQMEHAPETVPLEAWVWERRYTVEHPPKGDPLGMGLRRKAKHKNNGSADSYEEEVTSGEIEKHRNKPKIVKNLGQLIKIVTKRLDTREKNESAELTNFLKEANNMLKAVSTVVSNLGGVISDLATENRSQTTQRLAYEDQLRRQAEELRRYAEELPDKHPMKNKILEAVGLGAKLFLPKLTELAKAAGLEFPSEEKAAAE